MADRKVLDVKVGELRSSGLNPRKSFDGERMGELVASVAARGVLVPLLVRPAKKGKGYEIIAGERRWRAAKKAKLKTVPVLAEAMEDELVVETMVVENGQRADLHPLEEAAGFAALIGYGRTAEQVAERVGRPVEHVYRRLALGRMIEPGQKALRDGVITLAVAQLIARLPLDRQAATVEFATHQGRDGVPTLRDVRRELDAQRRELGKAVFDKKDAALFGAAGACQDCPKRSGAQPHLFAEDERADACLDPVCYDVKVQAHIDQAIAKAAEAGAPLLVLTREVQPGRGRLGYHDYKLVGAKEADCGHTAPGIMIDDYMQGQQVRVCVDKACEEHWADWERGEPDKKSQAAQRKYRADRARLGQVSLLVQEAVAEKVRRTVTARVPAGVAVLARSAWRGGGSDTARRFVKAYLLKDGEKVSQVGHPLDRVKAHLAQIEKGANAAEGLLDFLARYAVVEEESRANLYAEAGLGGMKELAGAVGADFAKLRSEADKAAGLKAARPARKKAAGAAKKAKKAKK